MTTSFYRRNINKYIPFHSKFGYSTRNILAQRTNKTVKVTNNSAQRGNIYTVLLGLVAMKMFLVKSASGGT